MTQPRFHRGGAAVTPSDTVNLPRSSSAIMVTVGGTVSVIMADGVTVAFTAVAGVLYPFAVTRVRATGTAATGITVWYG